MSASRSTSCPFQYVRRPGIRITGMSGEKRYWRVFFACAASAGTASGRKKSVSAPRGMHTSCAGSGWYVSRTCLFTYSETQIVLRPLSITRLYGILKMAGFVPYTPWKVAIHGTPHFFDAQWTLHAGARERTCMRVTPSLRTSSARRDAFARMVKGFLLMRGSSKWGTPIAFSPSTIGPPCDATALGIPAFLSAWATSSVPRSTPPIWSEGSTCSIFISSARTRP